MTKQLRQRVARQRAAPQPLFYICPGRSLIMRNKPASTILASCIAIAAISTPLPSFAYGGTGWGSFTMVTIYRGSERPGALINHSATFTNNDGCAHPENLFIDFSVTESPDGKTLYATALAAQLAGKSVSVGTKG